MILMFTEQRKYVEHKNQDLLTLSIHRSPSRAASTLPRRQRRGLTTIEATVQNPVWSDCTTTNSNPGILNVNLRVAISGGTASFDVANEILKYRTRNC